MNGVDTVRSAFGAAHDWFDGTVADVTEEQIAYRPAGKAHSIGELIVHVHQTEDWAIQSVARGEPMVWEAGSWQERTGLPVVGRLQDDFAADLSGCREKVQPYAEAVRAAMAAFFDDLTDADLERQLDMSPLGMPPLRLGDFLMRMPLGNTYAHTGEISALKGIQGARGYPF